MTWIIAAYCFFAGLTAGVIIPDPKNKPDAHRGFLYGVFFLLALIFWPVTWTLALGAAIADWSRKAKP